MLLAGQLLLGCGRSGASAPVPPRWTHQAIHPPLPQTSNAPTRTVGGVLPVTAAATRRPSGYISSAATIQAAAVHRGRTPDRQIAAPSRTLPTKPSTSTSNPINPWAVEAVVAGRSGSPSMPARYACPSNGAATAEIPMIIRKKVWARTVTTMASRPRSPARVEARYVASAKTPKMLRLVPSPLPITWLITYASVVT